MSQTLLPKVNPKGVFQEMGRELPVRQNALIAFTFWFWLISVAGDIYQLLGC